MDKKRLKKPHGRPPLYPWETVERARDLRDQGLSYEKIGLEVGVPWRTVADWVRYYYRNYPKGDSNG